MDDSTCPTIFAWTKPVKRRTSFVSLSAVVPIVVEDHTDATTQHEEVEEDHDEEQNSVQERATTSSPDESQLGDLMMEVQALRLEVVALNMKAAALEKELRAEKGMSRRLRQAAEEAAFSMENIRDKSETFKVLYRPFSPSHPVYPRSFG